MLYFPLILLSVPLALADTRGRIATSDLPLNFERNDGQAAAFAKFLTHGNNFAVEFGPGAITFTLSGEKTTSAVRMGLAGSAPDAAIEGLSQLPGRVNYFNGQDPRRWHSGIPTYGRVKYRQVYRGIDMLFYGNQRRLEYDLIIAPGADTRSIELAFTGAEQLRIDGNGGLRIQTAAGVLYQASPLIYQEVAGAHRKVRGRYVLRGRNCVGFSIARYDRAKALIIDPVVTYSTYIGGSNDDAVNRIAVDAMGNLYLAGLTNSANFYAVPPSPTNILHGNKSDAYVMKLNPAGTAVLYATYLGGTNAEAAIGLAIDGNNNAYVTGATTSNDFPATSGAYQTTKKSGEDVFITKLDSNGGMIASTFLGGSLTDVSDIPGVHDLGEQGNAVAVDASGNVYVAGQTFSTDFPATAGSARRTYSGYGDGFVAKFNPSLTTLMYSTFVGGQLIDAINDIAVDAAGNAYIAGHGNSGMPVTPGSFQTTVSGGLLFGDAFVAKLNAAGSAFIYGTYLGGDDEDVAWGIAVDVVGNAYVAGTTFSQNFPLQAALQSGYGGGVSDVFVTKLDPQGKTLVYSTYLGGNGADSGFAIAIDASGNAYVAGRTSSNNFRATPGAIQSTKGSGEDAFLARLDPAGATMPFSTFLGGNGSDWVNSVLLDRSGNVYLGGVTSSTSFPVADNPLQAANRGGQEGFAMKLDLVAGTPTTISNASGAGQTGAIGSALANPITVLVKDARNNPVAGATVTFASSNATFNPATAQTNVNGITSTIVTLGNTVGPATITATVAGLPPISIMATAEAGRAQVLLTGVTNAASFAPAVAVGSVATLFGSNLATAELSASGLPLPTELGGVKVMISGKAAPLFYVNQRQINFQIPYEAGTGPATITVTSGQASSAPMSFNIAVVAPGIVQFGANRAVVINQSGAVNNVESPAPAGSFVTAYLTGIGAVDTPVASGDVAPADPLARPLLPAVALIGTRQVDILFLGLTPGGVGLAQANIQIPPDMPPGDYPLSITIGGAQSNSPRVTIAPPGSVQ